MPVQLVIQSRGGFSAAIQTTHLFVDLDAATQVFEDLNAAAKAYNDRANDRERMFTFDTLTGRATIDVSEMASAQIDDALGDNRALIEEWNIGVAEIVAKAKAAGDAIAGKAEAT